MATPTDLLLPGLPGEPVVSAVELPGLAAPTGPDGDRVTPDPLGPVLQQPDGADGALGVPGAPAGVALPGAVEVLAGVVAGVVPEALAATLAGLEPGVSPVAAAVAVVVMVERLKAMLDAAGLAALAMLHSAVAAECADLLTGSMTPREAADWRERMTRDGTVEEVKAATGLGEV